MSRQTIVQGAADFFLATRKATVIHVTEDDINLVLREKENVWDNVESIPGISSFHVIKYENDNSSFYKNAMSNPEVNAMNTSSELTSIKVGDWVIVKYDGVNYPGEVTGTNRQCLS